MRILVLNPGSSSLKYHLYEVTAAGSLNVVDKGISERIRENGKTPVSAAQEIVQKATATGTIDAVGYRVVHGGTLFTEPTRVEGDVLQRIRELGKFAPLHNPIAADVIAACQKALPEAPHIAVFDTAFHRTLPAEAFTYAIPHAVAQGDPPLRRYGFHGIAHQSVYRQLQSRIGGNPAEQRFVTCHLGNGASVCAIKGGKSIDTSMGLTPLEGLVMGTRSGDLDPALVLYLVREGKSADEVDDILNERSGLKGISGISSDLRDLEKAATAGGTDGERAELAMNVFAYRVAKYIGAYAVALGGIDAAAFSGGIGEHSASMRSRIASRLDLLGVHLDSATNSATTTAESPTCITMAESKVPVWVVPVDEEGEIARTLQELLAGENYRLL